MIGDLENHGFMRKIDSLWGNETRWGMVFPQYPHYPQNEQWKEGPIFF